LINHEAHEGTTKGDCTTEDTAYTEKIEDSFEPGRMPWSAKEAHQCPPLV